jgi:hypothetical protein
MYITPLVSVSQKLLWKPQFLCFSDPSGLDSKPSGDNPDDINQKDPVTGETNNTDWGDRHASSTYGRNPKPTNLVNLRIAIITGQNPQYAAGPQQKTEGDKLGGHTLISIDCIDYGFSNDTRSGKVGFSGTNINHLFPIKNSNGKFEKTPDDEIQNQITSDQTNVYEYDLKITTG